MLKSFLQRTNSVLSKPIFKLAPLNPESSLFQRFLHNYRDYSSSNFKLRFVMTRFNKRMSYINNLPDSSDFMTYRRGTSLALFVFVFMTTLGMVQRFFRAKVFSMTITAGLDTRSG